MPRNLPNAYQSFVGAFDAIAPPEAVIPAPIPVVTVGNVSQLADEIFEARGIVTIDDAATLNVVFVLRAIGGGGPVVEAADWVLTGAGGVAGIQREARYSGPSPFAVAAMSLDAGGVTQRSAAGTVDFAAFAPDVELPDATASIAQFLGNVRIFVPSGGAFLIGGPAGNPASSLIVRCVFREIPSSPLGF